MTTKRKAQPAAAGKDSPAQFAHHLSETLRIARAADFITARLYNDVFDAWNEFANSAFHNGHVWESEEYINLILAEAERQAGERGEG